MLIEDTLCAIEAVTDTYMLELGELDPVSSVLQVLGNSCHPHYFNFPVCNQGVSPFSCSFRSWCYTTPLLKSHKGDCYSPLQWTENKEE